MLYLAQVINNLDNDSIDIQLLANQQPNQIWTICSRETITLPNYKFLNEGVLILVEIEQTREIKEIKEAKEWILSIINLYFSQPKISVESLQQEKLKMEAWQRELTSQNLEITQARLELNSRLEQLQELEEKLKELLNKTQSND